MIICYIHTFQGNHMPPTSVHIAWAFDELVIGRNRDVDVNLDEEDRVSRRHVRVFLQDNRVWIEDLGSTNGTHLDGDALEPNTPRTWPPGQLCELAGRVRVWVWHVPDRTLVDSLRAHTLERMKYALSPDERASLDHSARGALAAIVTPLATRLLLEKILRPSSFIIDSTERHSQTLLHLLPSMIERWINEDDTNVASSELLIGEVRALEHARGPERAAQLKHIAGLLSHRDLRMLDLPCHWAMEHIAQLAQQRWRGEPHIHSRDASIDPSPSYAHVLASIGEIAFAKHRRVCSGKQHLRMRYRHELVAWIPTSYLSSSEREALAPSSGGYGRYAPLRQTMICPLHTPELRPHPEMFGYSPRALDILQRARAAGYLIATFED